MDLILLMTRFRNCSRYINIALWIRKLNWFPNRPAKTVTWDCYCDALWHESLAPSTSTRPLILVLAVNYHTFPSAQHIYAPINTCPCFDLSYVSSHPAHYAPINTCPCCYLYVPFRSAHLRAHQYLSLLLLIRYLPPSTSTRPSILVLALTYHTFPRTQHTTRPSILVLAVTYTFPCTQHIYAPINTCPCCDLHVPLHPAHYAPINTCPCCDLHVPLHPAHLRVHQYLSFLWLIIRFLAPSTLRAHQYLSLWLTRSLATSTSTRPSILVLAVTYTFPCTQHIYAPINTCPCCYLYVPLHPAHLPAHQYLSLLWLSRSLAPSTSTRPSILVLPLTYHTFPRTQHIYAPINTCPCCNLHVPSHPAHLRDHQYLSSLWLIRSLAPRTSTRPSILVLAVTYTFPCTQHIYATINTCPRCDLYVLLHPEHLRAR